MYFIEFEHDSRHLGYDRFGHLLVKAESFKEACEKIKNFSVQKHNPHYNNGEGFTWNEKFINARNFINLTIE